MKFNGVLCLKAVVGLVGLLGLMSVVSAAGLSDLNMLSSSDFLGRAVLGLLVMVGCAWFDGVINVQVASAQERRRTQRLRREVKYDRNRKVS